MKLTLKIQLVFLLCAIQSIPAKELNDSSISLSAKRLGDIIQRQEIFFKSAQGNSIINEIELTRKAQQLVSSYEAYISENPKDTHALILFGKFLRQVGQQKHALNYFLEADALNPKIAVVKQQLGNYLIENGYAVDAFPFLVLATSIDPKQPAYHYDLGNYLSHFTKELLSEKILTKEGHRQLTQESFKKAYKLDSDNFDYALRYGQSFFDFPDTSRSTALKTWENIHKQFNNRSASEIDYLKLCKARILIELGQLKKARALIESVSTKSFKEAKETLLGQANGTIFTIPKPADDSTINTKEKNTERKKGAYMNITTDPHLIRLKQVTERLNEERMLGEFKIDAIRAKVDQLGKIKMEFSEASTLPNSNKD